MVIDTSALVAVLLDGPERATFVAAVAADPRRLISVATVLEASLVVESRLGDAGGRELDLLVHRISAELVQVTAAQIDLPRSAWRRYGTGRHRAGLNYGDCFSYALAASTGEPLLCKGDDFAHTDVRRVELAQGQGIGAAVRCRRRGCRRCSASRRTPPSPA
jgi:ribonuclease VapC